MESEMGYKEASKKVKDFNLLFKKNNTTAVFGNYFKNDKYGYLNSSYFNYQDSIISVDIDSKYYDLSSGYRKRFSNIYKLAFGSKESLRLNILDEIDEVTAFNDIFEISNLLTRNLDILCENHSDNFSEYVRDFLIMLIFHVKCSDFIDKSLYGCYKCLIYFTDTDSDNISKFLDNIINCCHCSSEIHEFVSNSSKRFKYMEKRVLNMVFQKILSLLNIFQNYYLRLISSQSDFCIKDLIINKPKSLYITISSSDLEIYNPYIKVIINLFTKKIRKYYNNNIYNRKSVLLLIDEFQKADKKPLHIYYNNKKYLTFKKCYYENKLNFPVISSRTNFLRECKWTLKPKNYKKMWYHIPEEMYIQSEEVIFKPIFTSSISDDEELELDKNNKRINYLDDLEDDKLKRLFIHTDSSSSFNKDSDCERNKNNIEIIFYKDIKPINMYYTQKNENEINDLLKIFSHITFDKLIYHFNKKNLKQGFICILSGSAGTGKTETVLQIARLTGRNLVKYDATQISSGLIGIAACKVKEIFDSYYKVVENSKNYPILFINEADSIFSKRINLGYTSNHVSNLDENRTQTILLESLENFNGIMIATTNIASNFDPAFERRFLYKIVFDKPDRNTRMKILHNKLPELKEDERQFIINNYDLTGANIENISRKLEIKKIIKNTISFNDIKNLCNDEIDNCFTHDSKVIGF